MNDTQTLTPQEVGLSALQNMSAANRFNEWMFETIRPYVQGRILEIGSGIGNISELFVRNKIGLFMSDLSTDYCRMLREKFRGNPFARSIHQIDLVDENFEEHHATLLGSFDTVFALNVVEHIKDDSLALANCKKLLAPGGRVIILVPAYQALYNVLDRELEHYRRYTRQTLTRLVSKDFTVIHTQYFNLAGILGWFVSGTLEKKKVIPAGPLNIYNKLVPLFHVLDTITFHQVGLSIIAVGSKQ